MEVKYIDQETKISGSGSKPNATTQPSGFKIVDKNMCARDKFQYTVGEPATVTGQLKMCKNGLHFCWRAIDCMGYTGGFQPPYRYLRIVPMSEVKTEADKSVTLSLLVEAEMTRDEWLEQVKKEDRGPSDSVLLLLIGAATGDTAAMELALGSRCIDLTHPAFQAEAASCGHTAAMEYLSRNGVTNRRHAMRAAIATPQLDVIRFLLREHHRRDGLCELAMFASIEVIGTILDESTTGVDDVNMALEYAAKGLMLSDSQLNMVKYLIGRGATAIEFAACGAEMNGNIFQYLTSLPKFDFKKAHGIAEAQGKHWFTAYFANRVSRPANIDRPRFT